MLDKYTDERHLLYLDQPSSSHWVKDNFVIGDILGSGTFGTVYSVECRRRPGKIYAMKELTRNSLPKYIATELRILQQCGGVHNVMRMHAAHRDKDRVFIVMDYFEHSNIKDVIQTITIQEITEYMRNLLLALRYLHAKGIIHRDIKPSNFLYDRTRNRFSLIDFGLCQETVSSLSYRKRSSNDKTIAERVSSKRICLELSTKMNEQNEGDKSMVTETLFRKERKKSGGAPKCGCLGLPCVCSTCQHKPRLNVNKAGTPGFRAPEVLLKSSDQTPLIDIWAAGVTFLSLLCHQHPVMRPADDEEAIAQIAVLFGTAPLQHYADKIGVSLLAEPVFPGLDIVKFVRAVREGVITKGDQLRCTSCKILFYGNSQGICLCKSTEETSLSQLSPEERQVFEVLLRCLTVDPSERYSAEMLKNYFY